MIFRKRRQEKQAARQKKSLDSLERAFRNEFGMLPHKYEVEFEGDKAYFNVRGTRFFEHVITPTSRYLKFYDADGDDQHAIRQDMRMHKLLLPTTLERAVMTDTKRKHEEESRDILNAFKHVFGFTPVNYKYFETGWGGPRLIIEGVRFCAMTENSAPQLYADAPFMGLRRIDRPADLEGLL